VYLRVVCEIVKLSREGAVPARPVIVVISMSLLCRDPIHTYLGWDLECNGNSSSLGGPSNLSHAYRYYFSALHAGSTCICANSPLSIFTNRTIRHALSPLLNLPKFVDALCVQPVPWRIYTVQISWPKTFEPTRPSRKGGGDLAAASGDATYLKHSSNFHRPPSLRDASAAPEPD